MGLHRLSPPEGHQEPVRLVTAELRKDPWDSQLKPVFQLSLALIFAYQVQAHLPQQLRLDQEECSSKSQGFPMLSLPVSPDTAFRGGLGRQEQREHA